MTRQASPFSKQRELLDDALDRLRKYAVDPEWREYPGYQQRISKNIEAARAAFGNILQLLAAEIQQEDSKPAKKS